MSDVFYSERVEAPNGKTFHTEIIDAALMTVRTELIRATEKFGAFKSRHEGFAILKEEVDELWDDIKANRGEAAQKEAVQVAAMAVRYLVDCK